MVFPYRGEITFFGFHKSSNRVKNKKMRFLRDTEKQRLKNRICWRFICKFSYSTIKSWKNHRAGMVLASGVIFGNFRFWPFWPQNFLKFKIFFSLIHYWSMPYWWVKQEFFLRLTIMELGCIIADGPKLPISAPKLKSLPTALCKAPDPNFLP